jgi:hypothetical protein
MFLPRFNTNSKLMMLSYDPIGTQTYGNVASITFSGHACIVCLK